jgi:hypothetical protein
VTTTEATVAALNEAMHRLLDGRAHRTDGSLTITNLAREAGVSRATANRATDILTCVCNRIAERSHTNDLDLPASLREQIQALKTELAEYKRTDRNELTELRQRVHILAQHVQALTLGDLALRHTLSDDGPAARALRRTMLSSSV